MASGGFSVRVATANDHDVWNALRRELWPHAGEDESAAEIAQMLAGDGRQLIACDDAGAAIGFAEASLRHDHVNGCETSPVAFLEGIYVRPAWQHRGVGRALVTTLEGWARDLGITEFASDIDLANTQSHGFHSAIGFEETQRVVYFRKPLT